MLLVPRRWGRGSGDLRGPLRVEGLQGVLRYHRNGEEDAGIFGTTEMGGRR